MSIDRNRAGASLEREILTGYMHANYAESFGEFGTPCALPRCGGTILVRQIPEFSYYDAMGCYPLFLCRDWSQLHTDLEGLDDELVSLALVTDPFGKYSPAYLHQCFKDVVIPFKTHFIVDLSCPLNTFVSSHHRRYARKSLRDIQIEECQEPLLFYDEWVNLYATLIERHTIRGIPAFSKKAFAKQLQTPGLVMFRAVHNETTIGMILWYIQEKVGYYHLAAYNETGYKLRASFALFWSAIEYFADRGLRWLNLGAGAGIGGNGTDGLSRFKQGWSTETRTAYFCGRIFNLQRYAEIVQTKNIFGTSYFPAYRQGEFG
jgi:hypothetical protein